MRLQKQYNLFIAVSVLVIAGCFALFVTSVIRFSSVKVLLCILLFAAVLTVFRILLDRFYRAGYYTPRQAKAFYLECKQQGIQFVQSSNFESAAEAYRKVVPGTTLDESKAHIKLLNEMFRSGKKQMGG